jgi:cytochrome subunit of sulfide dehydrogenase
LFGHAEIHIESRPREFIRKHRYSNSRRFSKTAKEIETMPSLPTRPQRALLAALLVMSTTAAVGQSPAAALHTRALAATCANCHGTDGKAVPGEAMAKLAGQSKDYIATQLRSFRDGSKPATVMHQITKGYSDEQIEAIAAYFAAQK